jgi:hypothetical protein
VLFFGFDRLLDRDSEVRWQDGNKSPKIIPNSMDKRCSQHWGMIPKDLFLM